MKRLLIWLGILIGISVLLCAVSVPIAGFVKERNRVVFRDAEVSRGRVIAVVNSIGTIKPVRSVQVGSFVSGPIKKIHVDFNDNVKEKELLAEIDPEIYEASVARDRASLATRHAEVARVTAQLQQARNNAGRAKALRKENKSFISDTEMDQFTFGVLVLEAELTVAKSSVDLANANLKNSLANLDYTKIRSPVAGIVIDRKIDPGQTVAAQFQTPELFVVALDMKKEMRVFASVDETDIGLIKDAQKTGQPVRFTVDAYPDDLFEGKIFQVRMSSTTTQNVVTYPVVISAPNPDLKLLPGMTASISFQLRETGDVLRIPNAALRYYPQREHVRPQDRQLLDNKGPSVEVDEGTSATPSAEEKAIQRRKRNKRHIWVVEGEYLRAVEVVTGLSNNTYTEMVSGDLKDGQKLVTGIQGRN